MASRFDDDYGTMQVLRLSIRRCVESCIGMIKDNEGVE